MPTAPPRICPKCRAAITARRCPTCWPAWTGSSYGRSGTSRRGQKLRREQLEREPICQRPGCGRLAVTADHVVNLAAGGAKYDPENLQSLCEPHHREKTQAESLAGRQKRR